jgi:RecA/RadA recombinase
MDLMHIQSEYIYAEDALGAYVAAAESRQFGMLTYDSVGVSQAKEQSEKALEDQNVTAHMVRAKIMKNGLNTLVASMRKRNKENPQDYNPTLCLFLNHVQEKMSSSNYTVKYSPGGDHLKFLATARVEFSISESKDNRIFVKSGAREHIVGQRVQFKVKKISSSGAKDHDGWFIMYRQDCERDGADHSAGEIDTVQEIADIMAATPIGRALDIQTGNWFNLNGEKLNGVKQLCEYLRENQEAQDHLAAQIRAIGQQLY